LLRRAFVTSFGAAAVAEPLDRDPATAELDLRGPAGGADRPLPPFGRPGRPWGTELWLLAVGFLAIRAWIR
ncbi:MAG: hypothetical protein RL398_2442, partial [Planctomycetota bacterium]